ncbi:MAG: hypothetical protein ABI656_11765 [bacterium]
MAAIKCKGCGAYLSVKGLVNCPICQTYLEPAHHVKQAESIAPHRLSTSEWIAASTLVGITGLIVFIIWMVVFPSEEKKRHGLISSALVGCQYAIKSLAKFGDAEMPPYVKNYARDADNEFYFAWPLGSFHFTNRFGAREKMSASCIGVLSTGEITQMTLNGKDTN